MPETLEEFTRRAIDQLLETLPPEELRRHLTPEQRLEGLPPEQRLEGLSPEELLKGLSAQAREALARLLRESGDQHPV